jgi:hypothetical protein
MFMIRRIMVSCWLGDMRFLIIIALQEQEGLGAAGDDLDQPTSGVDLQV